ncbi:MAG: single-stranded DNA-binding protein [Terracidiphilus sp.]|jgi:single-strand DNA-binding protein
MGKSVNKVILLGHAGKDPRARILRSGTVVTLSLATSERYKDNRGEWQEHTEWHNLVGYQRIGEILRDYVQKGSKMYVEGVLRTRSWEDRESGQRRYRTEVVVVDVSLLSHAPGSNGNERTEHYRRENGVAPQEFSEEQEITREEVPF